VAAASKSALTSPTRCGLIMCVPISHAACLRATSQLTLWPPRVDFAEFWRTPQRLSAGGGSFEPRRSRWLWLARQRGRRAMAPTGRQAQPSDVHRLCPSEAVGRLTIVSATRRLPAKARMQLAARGGPLTFNRWCSMLVLALPNQQWTSPAPNSLACDGVCGRGSSASIDGREAA